MKIASAAGRFDSELAGAGYTDDDYVRPVEGESMVALLAGAVSTVHDADYVTTLLHGERAFIRRGPLPEHWGSHARIEVAQCTESFAAPRSSR